LGHTRSLQTLISDYGKTRIKSEYCVVITIIIISMQTDRGLEKLRREKYSEYILYGRTEKNFLLKIIF
jgi:hypothetical protein